MYGCMAVWVYGCMVVWLYGCMVVWLYGCMVVRLHGCMVVWLFKVVLSSLCPGTAEGNGFWFRLLPPSD